MADEGAGTGLQGVRVVTSPPWTRREDSRAHTAVVAGRYCWVVRGYAQRWCAYVDRRYLGSHDTLEEAQQAAEAAARRREP